MPGTNFRSRYRASPTDNELEMIDCRNNRLTELNASGLTKLKELKRDVQ